MALTIGSVTKPYLDSAFKSLANEVDRTMLKYEEFYKKFLGITDAELTTMSYTTEDIAWLRSTALAFHNLYQAYTNGAKSGSDDPSYLIRRVSDMLLF